MLIRSIKKKLFVMVMCVLFMLFLILSANTSYASNFACNASRCMSCDTDNCVKWAFTAVFLKTISGDFKLKQKGKGSQDAILKFDGSKLIVTAKNNDAWRNTSGKGAWTRLYNGKVEITPKGKDKVNIKVTGNWRNSSNHATWRGSYQLHLKRGRSTISIYLFSEDKRVSNRKRKSNPPKTWETESHVPSEFWDWIKSNDVEAEIKSSYERIK